MRRRRETLSIALPVMRVISNLKVNTLAAKAVLSNKTRIALAVDVTVSVIVNFDTCRMIRISG
jgi:hypothetical protein